MWILLLGLTSGLVAPSRVGSLQEVKLRSCSYAGVFLIEGNHRYSLTFDEAMVICKSLGTMLANMEQLSKAYEMGMETCRYGWDYSKNITILRKEPNDVCAKNMTGILSFVPTEVTYDVYCYDPKDESAGKNCTFEIRKPSSNVSETTGDSESRDTNNNESFSTTVAPVELHSYSTVIDAMKPTPSSFPHQHDQLADTLDQTTQSTTESTTDESYDLHPKSFTEEEISLIISTVENPGSGMGEITHTTMSESTSEDPKTILEDSTVEDNSLPETNAIEDDKVNTDDSDDNGGKIGEKQKTGEEPSSGKSSDWLVILLVILAVLAIILVAALVLTRNRWCGRSQTLMITSKSSNEGNGAAASAASPQDQEREQEMVTLMNKEKVQENGNTEEFTVITLEESPEKNQQA